jgi:hypothetical protein
MHDIWVMVLGAGWTGLKAVGQFIKDYQTLLTGFMALFAAVIALRYVYKQLHVNQVQTAIAAREVLFGRTRTIEHRRKVSAAAIHKITSDFMARLYQGDQDGEPDIDINWLSKPTRSLSKSSKNFDFSRAAWAIAKLSMKGALF